jgi:hypothetical protein
MIIRQHSSLQQPFRLEIYDRTNNAGRAEGVFRFPRHDTAARASFRKARFLPRQHLQRGLGRVIEGADDFTLLKHNTSFRPTHLRRDLRVSNIGRAYSCRKLNQDCNVEN